MTSTATASPAIRKFVATHAVGPVKYSEQSIMFTAANGRTICVIKHSDGSFDAGMAYRGDNCLGHVSTLKALGLMAAS